MNSIYLRSPVTREGERERRREGDGGGFILTDNLLPLSSSVDSSSQDAYDRERRCEIIAHVYHFCHGIVITYYFT